MNNKRLLSLIILLTEIFQYIKNTKLDRANVTLMCRDCKSSNCKDCRRFTDNKVQIY